jgi:hypothetical protein
MTASDFRPIRRSGLSARRRLLSPARADETKQRRRAEVNATGAIAATAALLPNDRQMLLGGALARRGL